MAIVCQGAMLLARHGTVPARVGAVSCLALLAVLSVWVRRRDGVTWGHPSRAVVRLAGRVAPDGAAKAARALALLDDGAAEGTSLELARLHAARCLDALPRGRILERAANIAAHYGRVKVLFVAGAVALAATRGFAILEGADVLLSRHHVAPVSVAWMDGVDLEARPPPYLHEASRELLPYGVVALPRGTVVTVRGRPVHPGRRLLLTDGASEVPFEDDGGARVVARWTVGDNARLRVVARFGDVTVGEADALWVTSVDDDAPSVFLEGAPRRIELASSGAETTIPITYEASDDHGLREIQLVLRAAGREDRRVLARLDGETQTTRGGRVVRVRDPFIARSHAPVEIRVEAEDNDPVTGPKWGASQAILVVPAEAGQPEAKRIEALRRLRDRLVDSLAARLDAKLPATPDEQKRLAEGDRRSVAEDARELGVVVNASYAGVSLGRRVAALLAGQMRRLEDAAASQARAPGAASRERLVGASERVVLLVDATTHAMGERDARSVARSLADVADDLTLGLAQMLRPRDRERGASKTQASVAVLEGGARSIGQLGTLGRDLEEVIQMDLVRVSRALGSDDLAHAALAASDLALALKEGGPSFSGGSGGAGLPGERGGLRGRKGTSEPGDETDAAFEQAAAEIERLLADHAGEIDRVEQMASDPGWIDTSREGLDEAKAHARAVRDAVRPLPSVGAGSDSWTHRGALAKGQAEAMARALDDGNVAEAVTEGRSSLDAIAEARRKAGEERWLGRTPWSDDDPDRAHAELLLDAARGKLEAEVSWAEEKQRALRKRASAMRSSELSAEGDKEERMAERSGAIRARGEGAAALPPAAMDALHQAERSGEGAANALRHGDLEEGLSLQRAAQRQLEAARDALGVEAGEEGGGAGAGAGGRRGPDTGPSDTAIPGADAHKGPDEFRRRVMEGLGQTSDGRQKDAVRRYADGLLR